MRPWDVPGSVSFVELIAERRLWRSLSLYATRRRFTVRDRPVVVPSLGRHRRRTVLPASCRSRSRRDRAATHSTECAGQAPYAHRTPGKRRAGVVRSPIAARFEIGSTHLERRRVNVVDRTLHWRPVCHAMKANELPPGCALRSRQGRMSPARDVSMSRRRAYTSLTESPRRGADPPATCRPLRPNSVTVGRDPSSTMSASHEACRGPAIAFRRSTSID